MSALALRSGGSDLEAVVQNLATKLDIISTEVKSVKTDVTSVKTDVKDVKTEITSTMQMRARLSCTRIDTKVSFYGRSCACPQHFHSNLRDR